MITVVAIQTVRRAARSAFEAFETKAAALMEKHGGRIEHTVRIENESETHFCEVHRVTFPTVEPLL